MCKGVEGCLGIDRKELGFIWVLFSNNFFFKKLNVGEVFVVINVVIDLEKDY